MVSSWFDMVRVDDGRRRDLAGGDARVSSPPETSFECRRFAREMVGDAFDNLVERGDA